MERNKKLHVLVKRRQVVTGLCMGVDLCLGLGKGNTARMGKM